MKMAGVGEYNKTQILSRLYGLTKEDRARLLLSRGLTEEEAIRYLSQDTAYVTQDDANINQINHMQAVLLLYVPPVLLVIGLIGNILSFVILRRRLMTKQSTYLYLAALTVADSLVLFVGPLRLWLAQLMNYDIKDQSDCLCKIVVFLGYTTSDISVWLIIAVTVERYIAVCHPLRANTMCRIPRAKKVIILVILCLTAFNVHFFWTVEISSNVLMNGLVDVGNTTSFCRGRSDFIYVVEELWPWVDAFVYSFLPFFVITSLNCVIIRRVTQAYKSRCAMRILTTVGNESRVGTRNCPPTESNTKMTAMLLTVSFTFLLTTLPMNICLIVSALGRMEQDRISVARFNLAETVTMLLMYTNHSINIFLYCATGKKFRQHLLNLICTKRLYQFSMNSTGTHQSLRTNSTMLRKTNSTEFRKTRIFSCNDDEQGSKAKVACV